MVPQLHEDLVQLLVARGRTDEAIEALRGKIVAVEPTAEDRFLLAGLLVEAGRLDEAVQHFEASVALAPDGFQAGTRYPTARIPSSLTRIPSSVFTRKWSAPRCTSKY